MLTRGTFSCILKNSSAGKSRILLNPKCDCSSSFTRINNLLKSSSHKDSTTVKGWVKSIRKLKNNLFVDVNDGSSCQSLQVVIPKEISGSDISYGSSVIASGSLVFSPNNQLELQANKIQVIGECSLEGYPFRPKKSYSNEHIRQYLHLRFRTRGFSSLLRIRNEATTAMNDFFQNEGYINIHTPILTSNDCEGAGEVFSVTPESKDLIKSMKSEGSSDKEAFFDCNSYLTVSGQLHLEAAARGIGSVYTFGPTFRAENSKSRLHLSEFYMAEAETPFVASVTDITTVAEKMVKYMCNSILNNCIDDVNLCRKTWGESGDTTPSNLENLVQDNFTIMTYSEASEILRKNSEKLSVPHIPEDSFSKEHELYLVKHNSYKPLFVVDWPARLKPFYMKENPENTNTVMAFDLLCGNVGELFGGSLREDDHGKLQNALNKIDLLDKLEWYLDLRKYGNVTTGGFGMGFERFLQALLNISNIKDTIPFPRWPHNCKM